MHVMYNSKGTRIPQRGRGGLEHTTPPSLVPRPPCPVLSLAVGRGGQGTM